MDTLYLSNNSANVRLVNPASSAACPRDNLPLSYRLVATIIDTSLLSNSKASGRFKVIDDTALI